MRGIEFGKLKMALVQWVENVLDKDIAAVVWQPWPGTKPRKPFVDLKIAGPAKIGHDNFDGSNLGGQRRFTVTVNAYAENPNQINQEGSFQNGNPGAIDLISRLQTSFEDPNVIAFFSSVGIGEIFDAVDLSGTLETKFEDRRAFDFYLFTASNVTVDAGQISQVADMSETLSIGTLGDIKISDILPEV